MHNVHIAEWILALVTTRDRAASIVGDLTEAAATRGTAWFWSGVLRTAASLLWRDIAENPGRVAGLAFLGLTVYIGIDLLFAGLSGVVFFLAAMTTGYSLHLDPIGWRLWITVPVLVGSLSIGRMVAYWAPRRELATCVMFAILASIYNLVPTLGNNGIFSDLLCILIVPAGAAWGRHRRLGTRPGKLLNT
jgi:hypothetical protein